MAVCRVALLWILLSIVKSSFLPTITNSTGQFYISNLSPTLLSNGIIDCGTSYCNIECNTITGCANTSIHANGAQTLSLHCTDVSSCVQVDIQANTTSNIEINCVSDHTTSASEGACFHLIVNAPFSKYTEIHCANYDCHYATFDFNYARDIIFEANGDYASVESSIYMNYAGDASTTIHIQCTGYYGCSNLNIFAQTIRSSLIVDCINSYSCHNVYVIAGNDANSDIQFTMNCNALYACQTSNIHSSDTMDLTVHCDGASSCDGARMSCPDDGYCTVHCNGAGSCTQTHFFSSDWDHFQRYFTLNCEDTDSLSCSGSQINCGREEWAQRTLPRYISNQWECPDFVCCPWETATNITCDAGTDCIIDSGMISKTCNYRWIDARDAKSLTIECDFTGCAGAVIDCPTADESYCLLVCNGHYSCEGLDLRLNAPHISLLQLHCTDWRSCNHLRIIVNDGMEIIDAVDILGSGNTAMEDARLDFNLSGVRIGDLNVYCLYQGCMEMTLYGAVLGYTNITCIELNACARISVDLNLDSVNASVDVLCSNTDHTRPSASSWSACVAGEFRFGNDGTDTNDIAVQCPTPYDCYRAVLSAAGGTEMILDCNGSYSCWRSTIEAETADNIFVTCTGSHSCDDISIRCPSEIDGCNIDCSGDPYSCYAAWIGIDTHFEYNEFNLNCDPNENTSCANIHIQCFGQNNRRSTDLYLDDTQHRFTCTDIGNTYCCPWFYGDTFTCNSGEDCTPCLSHSHCDNIIINASDATSLSMECDSNSECANAIVYCPVSGCEIQCNEISACDAMLVIYDGMVVDKGSIKIYCNAQNACDNMQINAEYLYTFDLRMTKAMNNGNGMTLNLNYARFIDIYLFNDQSEAHISSINLVADYAQNVNITCAGINSCRWHWLYVRYVDSLKITGHGQEVIYGTWIHAEYARDAQIECVSYYINGACAQSYWYLPTNATFHCYGRACIYLGDLYFITDASNVHFTVDGMDECSSVDECLSSFEINCNRTNSNWYRNSAQFSSNSDPKCSVKWGEGTYVCGCDVMYENIEWMWNGVVVTGTGPPIQTMVTDVSSSTKKATGGSGSAEDVAPSLSFFVALLICFVNTAFQV